jgi:hypothetical protein
MGGGILFSSLLEVVSICFVCVVSDDDELLGFACRSHVVRTGKDDDCACDGKVMVWIGTVPATDGALDRRAVAVIIDGDQAITTHFF